MNMLLAGDAVQLIRASVLDNHVGLGTGTGTIREHYDVIVQKKGDSLPVRYVLRKPWNYRQRSGK